MTGGLALPRGRGDTLLAQRFGAERRTSVVWVLLWVLGAAATFGALAPVLFRHVPFEPIDVAFRIVGASFVACGLVAWRRRPDNHSGLLMTATGFALFASPLLAQVGSPLAKTLALVLPDLWVVFFVPLVLTLLTGGRLRTVLDRVLVAAVLLEVFVLAPAWLMFAPEDGNLLLVVDNPGVATALDTLQRVLFIAIPVGTALVLGGRYRAASTPGRRALLPGVAGAACLLLFALMLVVQLIGGEKPQLILWVATCSLITVPVAFLAGLLRSRLARAGVADLFRDLRSIGPVELQAALARVLGDPRLLLAFPHGDGLVDASGRPVTVPDGRRAGGHAGRPRGGARGRADLRPSLEDDPELVEAVAGGGRDRARERAAARRVRGAAGRAAGLARAHRRGRRRRAAAARAQPARRRPAAAGRARAAAAADPGRHPPRPGGGRGAGRRPRATSSPSRWRSCASSPAASTRRSSNTGWTPRWTSLAIGRRSRPAVSCDGRAAAQPVELAAYFVASEALANVAQVRAGDGATVRVVAHEAAPTSRSPTTGSAAPIPAGAPGCRASPTGWRRSADGSTSAQSAEAGTVVTADAAAALSARSDRMSHAPSAATTRPSGTP